MRALVLVGGHARGAFVAGALAYLERTGMPATYWDVIITTSSGGWNAAYALCGQLLEEGLRLWREHLPNGFLRFERGRLRADFAYLERLARQQEPLAVGILRQSRTTLFVTATDLGKKRAVYTHLNSAPDPVASLIIGSAMPIVAKPVLVGGRLYADGGLTAPIPLHYAEQLGADEIWIVLTVPQRYRNGMLLSRILSRLAGSKTERELLVTSVQTENQTLSEIEERDDLIVIRPPHKLPHGFFSRNRRRLARDLVVLGEMAAFKSLKGF